MLSFFWIARGENAEVRGNLVRFAREIVTDDLPTVSRIGRFEKLVGGEVQRVRLERRKNYRKRARVMIFAAANRFRRDLPVLADVLLRSREPVGIKNVRIEWIDGDVAILENPDQMPIAKSDFAVIAAALRGHGAALLLRAVNPVRKTIVGGDVIELRRWLVVPTAPRLAAVHADDRALIGAERDNLRMFHANPDALIIVAAGGSFETYKCFSSVRGLPRRGVRNVNDFRIVRSDGNAHRARTAAADAAVAIDLLPRLANIIGTINARVAALGLHPGVLTVVVSRSSRQA